MKKKIIIGMLFALLTCGSVAGVCNIINADSGADEETITYLPVRQTFEAAGFDVGWDSVTQSIRLEDCNRLITLQSGYAEAVENGQEIPLGAPVKLINGTAYIPEMGAEALGVKNVEDNGKIEIGIGWLGEKVPDVTPKEECKPMLKEGKSLAYRINAQMNQNENYVFSPYSLKSAMAMAVNGAGGNTKIGMLTALGYKSVDILNADMRAVNTLYNMEGDIKLSTANSIWINESYPQINSEFAKALKDNFDAETDKGTPKNLPSKIKAWVDEKSNGMQKDFNVEFDDNFAMAIVNTTYLKAEWQSKFDAETTYKQTFTNADGSKSETYFMHDTFYQDMYKDDNVQMIKLDYIDGKRDLSFYAATAPEGTDLESYIPKLENKEIALSLPKFKCHTNMKMNDIVSNLGAKSMLTENADFSGIFGGDTPVYVSHIIQDTVIDVDEEGTEAASTTMMAVCGASAVMEPPVEITFDKPFTYFIRDNASGEILFMGRFANAK